MTDAKPRRRWRWYRFRLRTLLLMVLVVGVPLGYLARRIHEGQRQQVLAGRLSELGCGVDFSHYESVSISPPPTSLAGFMAGTVSQSTLPDWVEGTPLVHAFRRNRRVNISNCTTEKINEAIDLVAQLGSVPTIFVSSPGFDVDHLERLMASVRVESLLIQSTKLTRGRLPCLKQPGMKWLYVAQTQFSNPAIEDLPATLEYFDATRTRINDEGLSGFRRLGRLKTLILRQTPTSLEAIEELRKQMPWCKIKWQPIRIRKTEPVA